MSNGNEALYSVLVFTETEELQRVERAEVFPLSINSHSLQSSVCLLFRKEKKILCIKLDPARNINQTTIYQPMYSQSHLYSFALPPPLTHISTNYTHENTTYYTHENTVALRTCLSSPQDLVILLKLWTGLKHGSFWGHEV